MTNANRDNFERARDLVMKYGWNSTCFQIVNPGIEYWFGTGSESAVGYVTSGSVRVVAGAPVCSEEQLPTVSKQFEIDAANAGSTVCYFGAEGRLDKVYGHAPDHSKVLLGAQPVWDPAHWADVVSKRATLRAQFNRARNKGVSVTEWPAGKAHNNESLRSCLNEWLSSKGLPALHFVIEPETLERLENRRIFVAERSSEVVAFLILSPIPERNGWLTEQFPHRPSAPNGTVELMIDTAIRGLAAEGYGYVTFGLSPLSKRARIEPFDNPLWLRFVLAWMRKHGQRFYNFDGLDRFKSKFNPDYWEPIFAISNEPVFSRRTMWAIASAFTENRPFKVFGGGLKKAVQAEFATLRRWLKTKSTG